MNINIKHQNEHNVRIAEQQKLGKQGTTQFSIQPPYICGSHR